MFGRAALAVTVAALAAFGGGCGTLINQSNEPGHDFYSDQFPTQIPYGGVLRDLAAPPAGVYQAATAEGDSGILTRSQMIAAAVFVPPLDLPFSLIGDTVFLPLDLAHTLGIGQSTSSSQAPAAAPPPPPVTTTSKSQSTAASK
jgi:uncharacterized protein YceK